jgi:ABC-type Fe3+-hydroxamate transport system substrate-binding protein
VRVVSLVPSATETLLALGVRPVAGTRFCDQPGLPTVGGTKNPDVAAVVALRPDVVVVNNEENRRADADALAAAGLTLHDCSPRSVADVGPAVAALADAVGVAAPAPFKPAGWRDWLDGFSAPASARTAVTFVWRRPWMTLGPDTYGASVLAHVGLALAAPDDTSDRYPTVTLEAVRDLRPAVALLPSEPYPFRDRHRAEVQEALPGTTVRLVDGRDLFWWGSRTPAAVARLAVALS